MATIDDNARQILGHLRTNYGYANSTGNSAWSAMTEAQRLAAVDAEVLMSLLKQSGKLYEPAQEYIRDLLKQLGEVAR